MRLELEGKRPASPEVIMEMLSTKYGWTPNQIREISLEDIAVYMDIINQKAYIEKAERKRAGIK